MAQYLYLVRHGEQLDAQHGVIDGPLSPRGVRQANAIAERLSGVPFDRAWHSPIQRADETAKIMAARMPGVPFEPSALLMDCVPSGPSADTPSVFQPYFGRVTEEEIDAGAAQMFDAGAEWLTPSIGERHELLVTHNAVIAWFVRGLRCAGVAVARRESGPLRAHDHPGAHGEAAGAADPQRPGSPAAGTAHRAVGRAAILSRLPSSRASWTSRTPSDRIDNHAEDIADRPRAPRTGAR